MTNFHKISDTQYHIRDNNDHDMGYLIADSFGVWIYYIDRKNIILTMNELSLIGLRLAELNKKD